VHSVLRRRLPVAAAVIMLAAGAGATAALPAAATAARAAAPHATFKPPRIKHVWVILLENESFGFTFGAGGKKEAPFLARTLPSRGALLTQYFGIGHHSLDNYIALASGQAPDIQTGKDCKTFSDFTVAQQGPFTGTTSLGQVPGDGCVYPSSVKTRRIPTPTSQASRAPAAAGSARSCCPRSSGPAPTAPWPTTSTRCCAAWRTYSG
jgi:phosphatidylinositol-3-phosphatase